MEGVKKCRRDYGNEKINSILASNTEAQSKSVIQRWRLYGRDTNTRLSGKLKKYFPDGSSLSNMYYYIRTKQTFRNFVFKSIVGFVGGIVLTYLCFVFFVFQLSISLVHATIMSSIIGVLLTLGLTFSNRIRCLVLLLIPQMFSRVGRYTLTCYALVLILTGPATNTFKNSEVLSESMACSQEQIKTSVRQINESLKKPFNSMKESIKLMIDTMKSMSLKLNAIVTKISILITSIADVIQSSLSWLNSVDDNCTQMFGTPYDYCIKAVDRGVMNCKKTLGVNLFWMCNASSAKSACMTVKSYTSFCFYADYATSSFAATLKRRLRMFTSRVNAMLVIDVKSQHTYTFSSNASSSASQVAAGIVTEIRNRADPLLTWLSWSSYITSLFLLLIIFRAKYYQHMFETRSRFDNRYVTRELRELDLKRYIEGRETVLPLNRREQAKYISVTSFRLLSSEKLYLSRSIIVMTITTFKLLIHIIADYSLYWVLMTIRYHGSFQTNIPHVFFDPAGTSDAGVHISGRGTVADFMRSIFESLTIPLLPKTSSTATCLPNPYPPDLQRYTQIAILIILLWFFALFEPYGLRLRHVIMGQYRPERAKTRAAWLYNHILRTRASFMKLARRKLHREYKYSNQENLTFRHWIDSLLPFWFLRYIFGTLPKELHCLLCYTLEERNDLDTKLISCETPNCVGVYCTRCYSDIGCLCTICLSPADYGDMSHVSLEKGTSDDSETDDQNHNTQYGQLNRNGDEGIKCLSKGHNKIKKIKRKRTLQYDTNQAEEKISLLPSDDLDDASFNNEDNFWCKMKINTFVTTEFNIIISLILEQKQTYFLFYNNKKHCYKKKLNIINGESKKFHRLNCKYYTNKIGNNSNKCKGPNENKFKKDKVLGPTNLSSDIKKRTHTKNFKFKKRYRKKLNRKNGNNGLCYILKVLSRFYFLGNASLLWKSSYKLNIYSSKKSKSCFRISKINTNANTLRHYKRRNSANKYIIAKRRIASIQSINMINKYRTTKNNNKERKNTNKLTTNIKLGNNSSATNGKDILKNKKSSKKVLKNKKQDKENENRKHCCKRMKKICSLCSSCFIQFRTKITSSKETINSLKKKTHLFFKHKANFKRRKKRTERNKIEDSEKNRIAKQENVITRNYRLSTYLLDQTWLKQKFCKDPLNERQKRETALSDLAKLRLKAANQQAKETELLNIIKKTFSARVRKCFCPFDVCICERNPGNVDETPGNQRSKGFSLRKKYCCKYVCSKKSASEAKQKKHLNTVNDLLTEDYLSSESPDPNIVRRMNFYSTLGNHDFDVIDDVPKPDDTCLGEQKNLSTDTTVNSSIVNSKSKSSKRANPLKFDFERLSTSIKSMKIKDIKLAVSERFLHLRIKNPLPMMRYLYSTLLETSSKKKNGTNDGKENITDEKGVLAIPAVQSCSCQYIGESAAHEDLTPQFHMKHAKYVTETVVPKKIRDAEAEATRRTCTCATEYRKTNKDKSCSCMQLDKDTKEFGDTADIDYSSELTESSVNLSTLSISDDTKTDTTVCSRVAIDYEVSPRRVKPKKNVKKIKINVVTKTNQGTTTDKAQLCDVSTITSDWWSPIVERKFPNEKLGRKENYGNKKQRKLQNNDRSVSTDGRVVTFMSRAQIIPTDTGDILSASRYLLESQKYYNELFSSKFYSPRAYPVNIKSSNNEKRWSSRDFDRKDRKPKRLNKRYSPNLKISKSNVDKIRSDETTSICSNGQK